MDLLVCIASHLKMIRPTAKEGSQGINQRGTWNLRTLGPTPSNFATATVRARVYCGRFHLAWPCCKTSHPELGNCALGLGHCQ